MDEACHTRRLRRSGCHDPQPNLVSANDIDVLAPRESEPNPTPNDLD
jgi:hypothetical protein